MPISGQKNAAAGGVVLGEGVKYVDLEGIEIDAVVSKVHGRSAIDLLPTGAEAEEIGVMYSPLPAPRRRSWHPLETTNG